MGSLMSGWDSHILDPKSAKYKRNRSLTKEEIDSYWKSKKQTEDFKPISMPSLTNQVNKFQVEEFDFSSTGLQRSNSLPEKETTTEESIEEFIKKNGWWKRSSWAFLNEPPVLEQPSNTYAAQFHIANLANSNANNNNNNEISAQY